MLIHSNKMETTVFIHECQDLTKTSKDMQESKHFQCSSRYLLLPLFILLGLLIGGMVTLITVWMEQVTNQSDVIHGFNNSINVSGKAKPYDIFKVPQNGTYFLYCNVQKNESNKQCDDTIRLSWKKPTAAKYETFNEVSFGIGNIGNYVAEIGAVDVKLDENSDVRLEINCDIKDDKANLFYIFYQIRH